MCHLVFLVPLAGIPLFWILPPAYAGAINILLWIVFGLLGFKIIRAMRLPAADSFHSLIGSEAEIVSKTFSGRRNQYLVKADNELWTAGGPESLVPGEKVTITGLEGIKLVVAKAGIEVGGVTRERNCH